MAKNKKEPLTMAEVIYQDDDLLIMQTIAYPNQPYQSSSILQEPMLLQKQDSFGQFNLGLHVNDNPTQVLKNRCRLINGVNNHLKNSQIDKQLVSNNNSEHTVKQIYWLDQVHGNQVVNTAKTNNLPSMSLTMLPTMSPKQADALITDKQGVALAIMTADCVPIVLSNVLSNSVSHHKDDNQANKQTSCQATQVAAIHAGWKGLANGVIAQTIEEFTKKDTSIYAWVGASISVDAYEVSKEVCEQLVSGSLKNVFTHTDWVLTPDQLTKQITKPHDDKNKVWLDIQTLAVLQLQALGCVIKTEHIACSYQNNHYYSYRRKTHLQQPNTGRMAMLAVKL